MKYRDTYRIVTQVSRYVSHRDFRYRATPNTLSNKIGHNFSIAGPSVDHFRFNTLPDLQEYYSSCILEADLTQIFVFFYYKKNDFGSYYAHSTKAKQIFWLGLT